MEDYIQISKLNDFIFCPKSIYFHGIYESFNEKTYHDTPQTVGRIKHENVDAGTYSSAKRYKQGMSVFSDVYGLCGKIDIYDSKEKALIERKYKIKTIYQGYIYQLWAQYLCLKEMGYEINKLFFHSLADNKRYHVDLPDEQDMKVFLEFLNEFKHFDIFTADFKQNPQKCARCIYKDLCQS
jgi:CRISPR-associated exonuclease Cas4